MGRLRRRREACSRELAELGFDVLYLPPIHPIGPTNRKGPNNALDAGAGRSGQPLGDRRVEGGHTRVHPELGTLDDFERLVAAAARLGLEVALDFAIQCSPDHPWLTEHPEWFLRRPDGTLKYAENPPKKYQDIYNVDFDTRRLAGLWAGAARRRARLDRARRADLPRGQPAHEADAVLGVADRGGRASTPTCSSSPRRSRARR